ncbi:hypothetical protein [Streptomyces pseudovenezuelae]|uniref:Ricin B lectin domain-containing protein n=1 Tax=Streptomyces pseudovenezuelae TaxID=67350 RepID=A0ABT6LSZ4_9ACTN|nr:hypothetical protein [Streptomyces pseudovenezuelae]MDH6219357.1 hypothetical protein [Streptomyces pseudovenezuelae]
MTVPVGLSALMLTVAGSLSTASAATNWQYSSEHEGTCLASSPTTSSVWTADCHGTFSWVSWHWGADSITTPTGQVMRRLVSNANGDCLGTRVDSDALANPVFTSACGRNDNQFWSGDSHRLENDNEMELRTSDNGSAVYTDYYSVVDSHNIDPSSFVWWGVHD